MKAIWVNNDLDIDYNALETLDGAFSKVFAPSKSTNPLYIYRGSNGFNNPLLEWLSTHR